MSVQSVCHLCKLIIENNMINCFECGNQFHQACWKYCSIIIEGSVFHAGCDDHKDKEPVQSIKVVSKRKASDHARDESIGLKKIICNDRYN